MAGERKLTVVLAGDARGLQRTLGQVDGNVKGLGGKLGGLGRMATLGAGAAVAGIGLVGKSAVESLARIERIGAQTEAAIKSTGGSAGVTRKQIDDYAESIEGLTSVEAESVTEGQNLLLTFTRIQNKAGEGNDIFDQATEAMVDLSVAMGKDMTSSSQLVGKALNDPIAGLGALSKAGVQFTDEQKDTIKGMVEMGDVAGAQKVILGELETQFGGSAEALGGTMSGRIERLKHQFGTFTESIAQKLMPVAEKIIKWAAEDLPPALQKAGVVFGRIGNAVKGFGEVIARVVFPALKAIIGFLAKNKPVLIGVAAAIAVGLVAAFTSWAVAAGKAAIATIAALAPIIAIGIAIAALVAGLVWAYQNWGFFRTAVDAVAKFVTGTLWPALKAVAGWITGTLIPTIASVVSAFIDFGAQVIGAVSGAFNWVKDNWPLILAVLTGPIGLAVLAITRNWDTIKAGVTAVKDWIVGRFNDVVGFFTGLPGRISSATSGMFNGIRDAFRNAINWIIRAWNGLSFTLPSVSAFGATIGGQTISTPNISELHQGGVFQAPGGAREGLALLESGERVLSRRDTAALSRSDSMMAPAHSGVPSINIDLRGAIVTDDIAFERIVRDTLQRTVSRQGRIPGTNIVKATA